MWVILFPRDCTALTGRRKMKHFHRSKPQKAAPNAFSLQDTRILRILVRGEEGVEISLKGLGKDIR